MPRVQNSGSVGTIRVRTHGLTANPIPACEDQENGNLSWLLDFKLDSFIGANEERASHHTPRDPLTHKSKFVNNNNGNRANMYAHEIKKPCDSDLRHNANGYYGQTDNRNRCTGPKKPPFTYTELIEHALQERGELTVSAIYQWISEHFPYYKSNDDRWKNSVRHNLSINPHFRKGSKAPHGAGHLWAIASQDESKPRQLFNIASIRQAIRNEEANAARKNSHAVTIDEVAAATASITEPAQEESTSDEVTLEHCAEQILSGIKKEVEVQYLVPMMVSSNGMVIDNQQPIATTDPLCPLKETDFLNPVSKEVVAEECGLMDETSYLVTDQNPTLLSLAESEIVTADNLFGEELSFQFYEFTSSSQLQSA
ncbi:hypothetical protein QAD02_012302 [Eretmocerus hayati]|uniref:Uncharacterized protein n=1 Tax=Eretmocerus hayati TaxID=131215 RepID=A0ACC2P415_9HYME|nr:hypothetical protein QAD02_012302 [Eretmocerus hayati]